MIKITFSEPDTEEWRRWRADCEKTTKNIIKSVKQGKDPKINNDLYKKMKKEVYFNRKGPFHGKCAYCESHVGNYDDIDHFRPKKKVTDENDNPVKVKDTDGDWMNHPGYYWLAYDWKNLLPSCNDCNRAGTIDGKKTGKRSRFPVKGNHAAIPGEEKYELPFLIHPVFDGPKEHLTIDTETGMMKYLTERGEKCIEIFALNLRDRLPEEHRKTINEMRAKVAAVVLSDDSSQKAELLRYISETQKGKHPYSMAGRAAFNALSRFLIPAFEGGQS